MKTPALPLHPLRACQLCQHSQQLADGALQCIEPTVAQLHSGPALCTTTRRPDGACGPDATRMHWPALERQLQGPARPVLWAGQQIGAWQ